MSSSSARQMTSKKAQKPERRFQFIDNSNITATSSNATQVRRHVMQEYMREKRWENRARVESTAMGLEFRDQASQSVGLRKTTRNRASQRKPKPSRLNPSDTLDHNQSPHTAEVWGSPSPPVELSEQQTSILTQPTFSQNSDTNRTVEISQRAAARSSREELRFGLYLTPQSFAQLSDLGTVTAPPTPPPSDVSKGSVSPHPQPAAQSYRFFDSVSSAPAPRSLLSAARTDPFNSLPLTLSRVDQQLFDFYATVMPACSYGFERRDPRAHNWYLSVFIPEAIKSAVTFQNTILVHAANTLAWVRGLTETELAIEHRARASKMLSDHYQRHPFDTSDAVISATLSAAALEDFDPRVERRKYAWMHWRAAVQKIRDRGGPQALEQNQRLRMLINWSDYIFSGYDGHGFTFFFDHTSDSTLMSGADAAIVGKQELVQQLEIFLTFLQCVEHLALVTANLKHHEVSRQLQPLRYSECQDGRPLHRLLASSNGPRYTATGQLKQIIARLAALMTINVAIWEYRYTVELSEAFLEELCNNILHNDLDQHISVEALLQILLSGSQNPDLVRTERPWLVGRFLKIAKRLSRTSWESLNDFLLQCLTLEPMMSPRMPHMEANLRDEILNAPLASRVLPLMQNSCEQVPYTS